MSVNLNVSDFSADFFILDQEYKPTDAVRFLEGLNVLAARALGALRKPEDVELAFQLIRNANLVKLSPQDKTNIAQRIQDVYNSWVKVTFGDHSRYVPRERLAKQCGPKFQAQYTSAMKEALDRELDLRSADPSSTDSYPEDCKKFFLVYLQTGALPPEALGDNALNMLVLAEQHQFEGLIDECLDFLNDNLSIENLDTFLEFTQQAHYPQLELACLNFIQTNRESISEDLITKYQEKLSIIEASARSEISLTIYSSGKIEAEVATFTEQTADVLQKINKRFPIVSLILPVPLQNNLFNYLEQIAPTLKNLQELVIWNETPTDNDFPKLKNLFPKLKGLGNDAPFLNTFVEVKRYLEDFREPGEDDQESTKPLLLSLNLEYVPNLTDTQFAELTTYSQELYRLFITSDKITSVIAPEAIKINCDNCTQLTTLEVPKATKVDCEDCTTLTTLKVPSANSVWCNGCTALTTLEAPEATEIYCWVCTALTTLEVPEATEVYCDDCTTLTTLKVPSANSVWCNNCTALTTLEVPNATTVYCGNCTNLTTLKAPNATTVNCGDCTNLTALKAPKATEIDCNGCTQLTTLEVPAATYFAGESKPVHLIKMLINFLWAFLVKGYRWFFSLFYGL